MRLLPADLPSVRAVTLDGNVRLFAVAVTIVSV
jgi:hypothetical protein